MAVTCPYCSNEAELVTGFEVYPHLPRLYNKPMYRCVPCKAWVGCHPGTTKPLGRLANAELRKAKMAAHEVFDPLWRSGERTRKQAYQWLAERLGMKVKLCHIGYMDIEQCNKVIELCKGLD